MKSFFLEKYKIINILIVMVAHHSTQELTQEGWEFKASLTYIVIPHLKKILSVLNGI
jgi:hypothetical protein